MSLKMTFHKDFFLGEGPKTPLNTFDKSPTLSEINK